MTSSSLSQRGLIAGTAAPISSFHSDERFSSGLSGTPSALLFMTHGPKDIADDRAYDLERSPTTNDGAVDSSSQLLASGYTSDRECSKSDSTFPSHPAAASSDLSFPWRLFTMLSGSEIEEGFEEIVSWIMDGTAFKVHDQEQFVKTILPRYFKMTKYNSFTRQLYAYDFTWIRKGPERGGCK
jgi:hypothetical protein